MKYFKKIINVVKENIGTLTVVTPELVIKRGFNAAVETADTIMRVPAKNFYNYLGHWLVPDLGLKNTDYREPYTYNTIHEPRGLGVGPFSYHEPTNTFNDLTKFHDNSVTSISAPPKTTRVLGKGFPLFGDPSFYCQTHRDETISGGAEPTHYAELRHQSHSYTWEGNWGDNTNYYQTKVSLMFNLTANCERVPGNPFGQLMPTGYRYNFWIGDENDRNTSGAPGTYYQTPSRFNVPGANFSHGKYLYQYYNPYYSSSGFVNNDGNIQINRQIDIYRQPHSQQINFHVLQYIRGGKTTIGLVWLINNTVKPLVQWAITILNNLGNLLSAGTMGVVPSENLGDRVWDIIIEPFKWLEKILDAMIGARRSSTAKFSVDVLSTEGVIIDDDLSKGYPTYMRWGNMSERAYMYNQFYRPMIDANPCRPSTGNFSIESFRKPFLENKILENTTWWPSPYAQNDIKETRRYLGFIPNLFRLTFETNIGVFIEQLAKQHENNSIATDYSLQVKLNQKNTITNAETPREVADHEDNLDDIMFPTNHNVWNNYIENGFPDDATAGNLGFLQTLLPSADNPATIRTDVVIPAEYEDVFTRYNLKSDTIAEINDLIGDFKKIRDYLNHPKGYKLNTWTALCNSSEFETLSSDNPKNLSYKIIEYMLWYLDTDGIAYKTRSDVNSLINYEIELDRLIEEQKDLNADVSDLDDFHVIGTKLYSRECT